MIVLRLLFWLIALAATGLAVLVALANRQAVVFSLTPLPIEAPPLPLYAIIFASLFLGLVLGWATAKISALGRRRASPAPDRTGLNGK